MDEFRVRLGEGFAPRDVDLAALAEFLGHLARAIAAYAEAMDWAPVPGPAVSLVEIGPGSTWCSFVTAASVSEAVPRIIDALETDEAARLPQRTYEALWNSARVARSNAWSPHFLVGAESGRVTRDVALPLDMPRFALPHLVHGTTTLIGRCETVGGAEPRIDIRPIGGGKLQHIPCSEDLAQSVARRLYDTVVLDVEADFEPSGLGIVAFTRAIRLAPYRRTDAATAARHLSEAAAGAWDDVDVVAYVAACRSDDCE